MSKATDRIISNLKTNPHLTEREKGIRMLAIKNQISESTASQSGSNQNPRIPKSTFAKVVNVTSSKGKQHGFEELQNSVWFNNLSDSEKEGVTVDNFHNLMLVQAKIIQKEDFIKRQ
ncbi:hypothetical protein [Chryseobacterium sp. 5_R23647]|uniref:hypothetical protein n=1 Tax=Chryseobacterium sp. 5_R23647 TaxID=2258964 RepID=UPI000F4EE9AB|nr:hypothetical protein [Chryseobacterium sp. 5_R23647]